MGRKRLSSNDSTTTITSHSPSKSATGGMQQRNAANARERARMRVLSKAFIKLKTHLPWVPHDTKLSKLDTLRLATSYILHLTQILDNDELSLQTVSTPATTTTTTTTASISIQAPNSFSWPYSSCHRASSLCSMNGRLSTSSSTANHCYSNQEYDYQIQSELLNEHQENIMEEKPRVC
ncbi:unnamed protein product [Adineta ricciae]|uniref:BHLH domain-containing protein n=1 Tax=Adineta ricciae TaxID=249248 RepID=A0A815LNB5_ADIRI|nr:unnamed protein product [Adineta ricciae]